MGCAYGKPRAIQDSRESPREVHSNKGSTKSSRVASSRRGESFRLASRLGSGSSDAGNVDDPKENGSSRFRDDRVEKKKKERKNRREKSEQDLAAGCPGIGRIPKALEAEQVAAGWPSWLSAVAGEAIKGWVPRRGDSFEKLDKIGEGTYSSVYKARDIINKKIVALKRVRFDNMDPESVKFMAREILILRRLDHPNIIKLEGLVTSKMSCSLCLVFEYMEHDLTGLASHPSIKFTVPQVKCYMHQIFSGLEHCHSRGVLHRDIKGSNLLIDNSGILKIADFGLASFFNPDHSFPMTTRVVTLWYRPPELLLGASHYGVAVDLWSAGCILGELCSGKPIMPGRTEVEQLHKIFKLCGSPSEDFWRRSKLRHSTVFKPQRPYRRRVAETFKDIPAAAVNLMETLLSIDPALRGTAASALKSEFFTTKPLACDPSSLPKYPPCKEIDAKLRDEARRQRAAGCNDLRGDLENRGHMSQAIPAPNANAELDISMQKRQGCSSAKSRSEKFSAHLEEAASGFTIDPPNQTHDVKEVSKNLKECIYKKATFSGPLVKQAGRVKADKILDDPPRVSSDASLSVFSDLVATRLLSEDCQVNHALQLESTNEVGTFSESLFEMDLTGKQDRNDHKLNCASSRHMGDGNRNSRESVVPGYGSDASKIYFSGPLLVPSNNHDKMLKEHERKIQEVARRARIDKSKTRHRKAQAYGRQVLYNPIPISSRGSK